MERSEYRRYDPRLKNLVAASDDIRKFLKFGISLSTLREWKKNGVREFFSIPELELNTSELISENMALKAKLAALQRFRTFCINLSEYWVDLLYNGLNRRRARDIASLIKTTIYNQIRSLGSNASVTS